ncbi:ankyrin repeat-containing domain protein [Aspergillus parasiticus]|uniref:Ankyrin repeat-containing domain protein n=1 Tax=Aspergillus parasiticus TaxID=5067 RepID=A0A5N6DXL6_ASPPA|nr:ankyrin repeat-containing domain protein [Aspergillus parasiticus]
MLAVAKDGSPQQLRRVLDSNTEVKLDEINDHANRNLLYYAAQGNSEEKVRLLLDRGVKPAPQPFDEPMQSPLFPAIETGNKNVVQLLMDNGASIEIRSREEESQPPRTALTVAVEKGHDELVEMLLANGLDPHNMTNSTNVALYHAVDTCNLPVLTRLLDLGFDADTTVPDMVWYGDATLLSAAAERCASTNPSGCEGIIKFLLERGADPNSNTGVNEMPPISPVAEANRAGAVKLLLDHGASPTRMDGDGMCAFWRAAEKDCVDVVRIFLDYAVEKEWDDCYLRVPMSGAELYDARGVLKLLKEHEERYPSCMGCE